jgi:hypothetical protein
MTLHDGFFRKGVFFLQTPEIKKLYILSNVGRRDHVTTYV